ncbi:acetyl-CoA carboxylase biotin carboxyl carrier protein subunit [Negadavirga shengliensis]|uniref:Acetyl-CoA carboxylase biotin carboxyl carrier protein subunit n=1 Tax=Negadavirga shengliensis TaxID=1389218 RepID=A0ABV9SXZ5_9BACT
MYVVNLNKRSYKVELVDSGCWINGKKAGYEFKKTGSRTYLIITRRKVYTLEIISHELPSKLVVKLDHKLCEMEIKGEQEQLMEKLGLEKPGGENIREVRAPMPGLILDVKVKAGDKVKKNDVLLVLEAMKMENALKSPRSGIIQKVNVSQGNGVEKNQVLVQF